MLHSLEAADGLAELKSVGGGDAAAVFMADAAPGAEAWSSWRQHLRLPGRQQAGPEKSNCAAAAQRPTVRVNRAVQASIKRLLMKSRNTRTRGLRWRLLGKTA